MSELRTLIRQVAQDNPESSLREIAEYVAKLTPEDDREAFYVEALGAVVLYVVGQDRRGSMDGPAPAPRSNSSAKLRRRAAWWDQLKAQRVQVNGDTKLIGHCTVDDLQACVDEREKRIAGFQAQIANFQSLINLMVKHGSRTVDDLPPQTDWPQR
jgi:hypothetical protein